MVAVTESLAGEAGVWRSYRFCSFWKTVQSLRICELVAGDELELVLDQKSGWHQGEAPDVRLDFQSHGRTSEGFGDECVRASR